MDLHFLWQYRNGTLWVHNVQVTSTYVAFNNRINSFWSANAWKNYFQKRF